MIKFKKNSNNNNNITIAVESLSVFNSSALYRPNDIGKIISHTFGSREVLSI